MGSVWALQTASSLMEVAVSAIANSSQSRDLPSILENGMCHWKYEMIDEKKQQRKMEALESESQREGSLETSSNTQLTNADRGPDIDDEEMIDNDNGYVIQNGNLLKDGIMANGARFETGVSLEDRHQVMDSTGNVDTADGEDVDMVLDNEIHITA